MSSKLLPERFSTGDFASWLRHFERCASANEWDAPTKYTKSIYAKLTDNLLQSFSPTAERE